MPLEQPHVSFLSDYDGSTSEKKLSSIQSKVKRTWRLTADRRSGQCSVGADCSAPDKQIDNANNSGSRIIPVGPSTAAAHLRRALLPTTPDGIIDRIVRAVNVFSALSTYGADQLSSSSPDAIKPPRCSQSHTCDRWTSCRPTMEQRQTEQGCVKATALKLRGSMLAALTQDKLSMPSKVTSNASRCVKLPQNTQNTRQPICQCPAELVPEQTAFSCSCWLQLA
eukprot:6205586-Pleurochrysis_carterae.AAC.1